MTFLIKNRKFSMNIVKLNKSIIPFDVVHKDLFSLYIGHFDNIFEKNSDLSTFTKWPINFSFLMFIPLNSDLLAYKLLDIEKIFAKKIFDYQCVVIKQPINNSSFVFLFIKFYLGFRILRNHMPDFAIECNTTHFLLDINIKFVPNHMII